MSTRPTAPGRSARRGSADARGRRSATSGATTRCWRRWRSTRSRARCSPASRRSPATSRGCGRSTRPGRRCSARSSRRSPPLARPTRSTRRSPPAAPCSSTRGPRRRTPPATSRARCRSRPGRPSGRGSAGSSTRTGRSSSLVDDADDLDDAAAPGAADRLRDRSSATSTAGCRGLAAAGRPVEVGRGAARRRAGRDAGRGGPPSAPFVIDVRQATEYEAGHVPGASTSAPATCPTGSTTCRGTARSRRSARAATGRASRASLLRAAGFERVASVRGGVPDWEARGLPLEYGRRPTVARPGRGRRGTHGHAH